MHFVDGKNVEYNKSCSMHLYSPSGKITELYWYHVANRGCKPHHFIISIHRSHEIQTGGSGNVDGTSLTFLSKTGGGTSWLLHVLTAASGLNNRGETISQNFRSSLVLTPDWLVDQSAADLAIRI